MQRGDAPNFDVTTITAVDNDKVVDYQVSSGHCCTSKLNMGRNMNSHRHK
jgi:hypothetical protein